MGGQGWGERQGGRRGRLALRYLPREVLSRPGGPIRPFSFLPKSRPMDDLMLFFLGALWRESGVPSLEGQDRAWDGHRPPKSLRHPHPQPTSLLTFLGEEPHLLGTPPAVPKPGSSSQDGQSGAWVVGCLLEWLGPPLVEHQLPLWGHGSGDRGRCRISLGS